MVDDWETEGRNHSLDLAINQNQLISTLAAVNSHLVVVLKSGSAVIMPWVDEVPAILEVWYWGKEDGNAVAAILCSDVNPGGKLPVTFPPAIG